MDARNRPTDEARRLADLLLGYLARARASPPGADGLTAADVLDGYPAAVAAGSVPDWAALLARHPEVAPELCGWLAAPGRWRFADLRPEPGAGEPTEG
jgi:hypothetical protein